MWQNGRRVDFPRPPRDRNLLLNVLEVEDLTVPKPRSSGHRPTANDAQPAGVRRYSFATRTFQHLPFVGSDDPYADDGQRIEVELFANERSTKDKLYLYFLKNKSANIVIQTILFALKILTCVLYVVRGTLDDASKADCYDCNDFPCRHLEDYQWPVNCSAMEGNSELLCWEALYWVQNPPVVWTLQVAIAMWTLTQTIFLSFLKYKGNLWKVIDFYILLELVTTIPFIVSIFWLRLRNLFIPVFLNCWIAKKTIEHIIVYHKLFGSVTHMLSQHLLFVASTLLCLAFTAICGFEHIQRVGCRRYNFFESSYFVAVTLTTVGYGDLFPDVWLSKLYMVLMICIALTVMPKKSIDYFIC